MNKSMIVGSVLGAVVATAGGSIAGRAALVFRQFAQRHELRAQFSADGVEAGLLLRAPIVAVVPSVLGGLCAKLHVVFAGLLGLVAGPIAWYVVGA